MPSIDYWNRNREKNRNALLRGSDTTRVGIGHALVDNCSSEQICASIIRHAKMSDRSAYVVTANAQHIVLLNKNQGFREIYEHADLVIADGVSLLIAARLSGRAIQERIPGVDMLRRLCGLAADSGLRVFLLGGRPGSADRCAAALRRDYATLDCRTHCPPVGFDQSSTGLRAAADAIIAHRPHLLFVALGAPKQEAWIFHHGLQLSVPVSIGVGGSFEMVGGVVGRAPMWIQNVGCEWLFRLCQEPRRMWRRYSIGNLEFAEIVVAQCIRRLLLNACVRVASRNGFAAELQEIAMLQPEGAGPLLSIISSRDTSGPSDSLAM
jgi:N-acetylglucosaminyldiphosphoundecaprenol N-acetyl-beta-D-mannosaminyltransferase